MAIQKVETITGTLIYTPVRTALLREGTGTKATMSLLLIDNAPLGLYDAEDIAAAFVLLRETLKVPNNKKITIQGIRDVVSRRPIIAIVRLDAVMDLMFGGKL